MNLVYIFYLWVCFDLVQFNFCQLVYLIALRFLRDFITAIYPIPYNFSQYLGIIA